VRKNGMGERKLKKIVSCKKESTLNELVSC